MKHAFLNDFSLWWQSSDSSVIRGFVNLMVYSFFIGFAFALLFFGAILESLKY